MTDSTTTTRVSYTGDGTSVNFTITFPFYLSTDILVQLAGATVTNGYSISGGSGSTGTLTMATPPAAGVNVQAILNPPLTQIVNLVDGTAFPSATLNQVNDRSVQIGLRLQDQINRSIRAPDGDSAPVMLLSNAANRKNKALMFDSNGNLTLGVPNTQVITTDLLASFLGLQQTAAEITAGVMPVNFAYVTGDVRRYGADPTGIADSFTAFQNALKAVGAYGRVIVSAGQYSLASASLPLQVQASYQSITANRDAVITVTGSSVCTAVIISTNNNGLMIDGINFIGNSQANAYAVGGAITWQSSASASVLSGFTVKNCSFSNFKGDYWIFVNNNLASSAPMKGVMITDNAFISRTGNARQPAALGADSSCIGINGSSTSLSATIENVMVAGNIAECDYIKSFFVAYQSTKFMGVTGNDILRCGAFEVQDNCGAYAVMLYDSSSFQVPSRWAVIGNNIVSPRSCGIYLAAATNGSITGNTITGQTDTQTGTLPKGGVVSTGATRVNIGCNTVLDCFISIYVASPSNNIAVKGNTLDSSVASAVAVVVHGGSGTLNHIDLVGNSMNMTGTGSQGLALQSFMGSGNLIDQIYIADNKISSVGYCVQHISNDASYNASHVRIMGNKLWSALQHISFTNTLVPLTISGNSFDGAPSADGVDVSGSTQVCVTSNTFEDFTSTYALKTNGARGEMWANSFLRSTALIDSTGGREILGTVIPTWTGAVGTKVQNPWSGEQGSSSSKYLITGWIYSGSVWLPMRALDGN